MENLKNLWAQVMEVLPRVAFALLVFFAGWILAKILERVIKKLLIRSGVDKLAAQLNEIDIISNAKLSIIPSKVLSRFIYYILILVFAIAATDISGLEAVSDLFNRLVNFIPNLVVAFIILVVGTLFAEGIRKLVKTACDSLGIPSAKLIAAFIFYFIFINILISALSQTGVDTDFVSQNISLLIGGAVLAFALGYGFASKDIMANFLSSFYTKDKFKVGDKVKIGEHEGIVVDVDRTSLYLKQNGKTIILPMSKAVSEAIIIEDDK